MKTATILSLVAMSLCLTGPAFGQQALDETEVQGIIKQLTSQPRTTWISNGTIQGTHYVEAGPKVTDSAVIQAEIARAVEECQQKIRESPLPDTVEENPQKLELEAAEFNVRYELENTYTMTTSEIVKYDGQRFHWEIILISRSDSLPLDPELASNFMVRHFKAHEFLNQHRVFAWDGQKYTTYSASGDQGMVDTTGMLPHVVNGPLTAGLIPWGNGRFSAAELAVANISASKVSVGGAPYIQMQIEHKDSKADGLLTELVLDPSRDHAVQTAALTTKGGLVVTYECSGYQLQAGQWVPSAVEIERRNASIRSKVPTHERWTNIQVTSTATPSLSSFAVPMALDATVEYASAATASPVTYINSYEADTDKLLAKRLAYGAAQGRQPQNCATVALEHVASEFGKSVPAGALSRLVAANGRTSLYDLKQAARSLGLNASVVTTDLATLKTLGTAKAILYLPGKNHFVVLDRVDDRYVWLVDLSGKRFYYRQSVHLFPLDWPTGTAILISDQSFPGQFPELPDATAKEITAGYWLCNTLWQEFSMQICDWKLYEYCEGVFAYNYERWVCGRVDSGTCTAHVMVRRMESPCVLDPIVYCQISGYWVYYYVRACQ